MMQFSSAVLFLQPDRMEVSFVLELFLRGYLSTFLGGRYYHCRPTQKRIYIIDGLILLPFPSIIQPFSSPSPRDGYSVIQILA